MKVTQQHKNEWLMEAVESHNVAEVKRWLDEGADPNYFRSVGTDVAEDKHQPTTPLRLVMFRISDSFLTDDHLYQFAEIATLLLEYGARAKPAMELAELRYGKYNPHATDSPFMRVWSIVANGE